MGNTLNARASLLLCTALVSVGFMPVQAMAQAADGEQLSDIVVTAQKREQSVQDVPIAVTALTQASLANNRVQSVTDLSGLAPGVQVRPAAGGSSIPSFSVRGVTSYGVVPGSDKQVSIYLDGVYIGSPRGSIFNMPDARGIEVLRGPQGTLFGRNATAGAVSVTTRDPNGKVGADAEVTLGNYDQFRMRLSISTPQIGAFSAYGTYVHDYKRGDVKNLGAGAVWDRTASGLGVGVSPQYLGGKNADSYFLAVKFAPTDNFKMVYKLDHSNEKNTPEATALVGVNAAAPVTGGLFALFTAGIPYASSGLRPDSVNNSFSIPSTVRLTGHSLTSTWDVTDDITIKNIMAYRQTYVFAAVPIDGFSGVVMTAAQSLAYTRGLTSALAGASFLGIASQPESTSKQWSDELQINYRSKLLTLTSGLLWFHSKDTIGGPTGMVNTFQFATVFNAAPMPLGQYGLSRNDGKSLAAYAQAEFHLTDKLDLILGGRITKDNKSGTFNSGTGLNPPTTVIPFTYTKTKPNWLVGVNYKPNDDIMVYAKASTAFVSGGSVAAIPFEPEKATSFEAGVKAEWFDRHLRTNLSVYTVQYDNLQTSQGATNFGAYLSSLGTSIGVPNLASIVSTFIVPIGGPVRTKGFEFETTALLARGVTIGGNLSYHDTTYSKVDPRILSSFGAGNTEYLPGTLSPDWDGGVWGEVQSKPFANGTSISARIDANWHNKFLLNNAPSTVAAVLKPYNYAPASWVVNGRVALKDISVGGVNGEIAVWGKNLTQNRDMTYALSLAGALAANYQAARTLGVDIKIHY